MFVFNLAKFYWNLYIFYEMQKVPIPNPASLMLVAYITISTW